MYTGNIIALYGTDGMEFKVALHDDGDDDDDEDDDDDG